MATKIDMDWRPETYFPESPSRRQLLTKILTESHLNLY